MASANKKEDEERKEYTLELAFSHHIFYTFPHAPYMHQKKVVSSDNEWSGWTRDNFSFSTWFSMARTEKQNRI